MATAKDLEKAIGKKRKRADNDDEGHEETLLRGPGERVAPEDIAGLKARKKASKEVELVTLLKFFVNRAFF